MTGEAAAKDCIVQARRIGHLTYETPEFDSVVDHYRSVVGLSLVSSDPDNAYLATSVGQLAIHLRRADRPHAAGLALETTGDLDALARAFRAAGIAADLRSDSAPGLARSLAFRDPSGTAIDLFTDWRPLARSPAAGAAPIKFGHAAFVVDDPKRMSEFYARVLGFAESDWIGDVFVFMRCGADHHTVNFLKGEPASRLHHLAFEMKDTPHLVATCDLLGTRSIPILWGPVRHGPGHNVATYHRAPDGHMIEFFAELDRMTDERLGYFDPRPWHEDVPQRPKVWGGTGRRDVWGPGPPPNFLGAPAPAGPGDA